MTETAQQTRVDWAHLSPDAEVALLARMLHRKAAMTPDEVVVPGSPGPSER